jgi:hypothetical protein
VDHSVAVGTHAAQVLYWIVPGSTRDLGLRLEVVDVNETLANIVVGLREVEAAVEAVVVHAALGRYAATFVGVHGKLLG